MGTVRNLNKNGWDIDNGGGWNYHRTIEIMASKKLPKVPKGYKVYSYLKDPSEPRGMVFCLAKKLKISYYVTEFDVRLTRENYRNEFSDIVKMLEVKTETFENFKRLVKKMGYSTEESIKKNEKNPTIYFYKDGLYVFKCELSNNFDLSIKKNEKNPTVYFYKYGLYVFKCELSNNFDLYDDDDGEYDAGCDYNKEIKENYDEYAHAVKKIVVEEGMNDDSYYLIEEMSKEFKEINEKNKVI